MLRKLSIALCLLVGVTGLGGAASAQSSFEVANPSRMGPADAAVFMEFAQLQMEQSIPFIYRGPTEQSEGAWVARRFARCAVKLNQDRARSLLDSSIAQRDHPVDLERRYFRRMSMCTPLSGYVDVSLVRAAVAENILRSSAPPAGFRAASSGHELVEYLSFAEALEASAEDLVTVTQLGYQCRAAVSPSASYAVLDTEPGSDQEAAALGDLDRRTAMCDVFFDRGEEVSHWFRRAFLARGLYYWQRFLEI